ncbi:Transcription factor hamlet [Frankliniella fusca]|uniref:Transcription factor hamlet n=1 Tax=Frankliniella fusca TaxID=407009 RepID=A0AAE1HCL3_9NEOP|nr:Transcription factor hamlet [Frankliniella fusca]
MRINPESIGVQVVKDMEEDKGFSCKYCSEVFEERKNLYYHIRTKHSVDVSEENVAEGLPSEERLACQSCSTTFSCKATLTRHMKRLHPEMQISSTEPAGRCPFFPHCDVKVNHGTNVMNHLKDAHDTAMVREELHFDSYNDFEHWKEEMCNETLTQYTQLRGKKVLDNGDERIYLNCHRSGETRPQGNGIRLRDPSKIVKTGKVCPARIVITTSADGVDVTYFKTHVGHVCCLKYLRCSHRDRAHIAGLLKDKVPMKVILEEIASQVPSQRRHAIDSQDIHNIIRDFNLDTSRCNKEDAVSVDVWVDQMGCLEVKDSPVIFYKRQNEMKIGDRFVKVEQFLEPEDFLLVIMTPYQRKMAEKFASSRILIDSTHGTNQYDFQLTTLLTIDEFGAGVPFAFCISNRINETAMKAFFSSVKAVIGPINTEVFMSDDYPAYHNAWCQIMSEPAYYLLCLWHVQRNWKKNVLLIKNNVKQAEIYRALQVLLVEMDENDFFYLRDAFLQMCKEDVDTAEFGEYFRKKYASNYSKWAFRYRQGLRLNTNMYLEAMHKKLKYIYLDGTANKRVDKCIAALLKLSNSVTHDRFVRLVKNKATFRMKAILKSHHTSMEIKEDMITTIHDGEVWDVKSSDINNLEVYRVVQDPKLKCQGCPLTCWGCGVCVHKYACTCIDSLIRGNFCKHIHACLRLKGGPAQAYEDLHPTESSDSMIEELEAMAESAPPREVSQVEDQRVKLSSLLSIVNGMSSELQSDANLKAVVEGAERLLTLVGKKIRREKLETDNEEPENVVPRRVPSFGDGTTTPFRPRAVERQLRFQSTKNKTSKTANSFSKPSPAEINSLKVLLCGGDALVVHSGSDHTYLPQSSLQTSFHLKAISYLLYTALLFAGFGGSGRLKRLSQRKRRKTEQVEDRKVLEGLLEEIFSQSAQLTKEESLKEVIQGVQDLMKLMFTEINRSSTKLLPALLA